ncbi:MAG: cellulase family glycosylhydrolase, partial [Cellvibrio sp.]
NWNGQIQPGQYVEFGFQGNTNGGSVERPQITGAVCGGSAVSSTASTSSAASSSKPASSTATTSSKAASSIVSSVASSSPSSSGNSGSYCNWYGTNTPLCKNNSTGWGYENNKSCVGQTTCASQPAPWGVVGGNSSQGQSASSVSSSKSSSSSSSSGPTQGVAALVVSGNKVTANGQPANLAGMSLFWSNTGWGGEKYYTAQTVAWLKSDWKANLVRAAMGVDDLGGYLTDSSNKSKVTTVVDAAIANNMYVIIDWHTHHAEDNKAAAIAFFKEMATKYGQYNNVIYEIYNEPLQISWSNVIKPYATDVIKAIRAIDPDNLVIVGTPTWSQDVDVASRDKIADNNVAYTLHFYAGTHTQYLRDKAQTAMNNGAALFVTEWGAVNADGDGSVATSETATWLNFLKTNGISHANWALNDKAEGASALTPNASANGGWSSSQLTASGTLVRNAIISNNR